MDNIYQDISAADDLAATDDLTVGDDATITGDLTVGGALAVTGNQTFTGNLAVTGTLAVTGAQTFTGQTNIDGPLDHDGSTAGFFGTAPATQAGAYTQTYSTASKTVATLTTAAPTAITAAALTVADGAGTNDGTIAAITNAANAGSADVGPVIAAIQELADQVNKLVTDLTSVRTQLVAAQADILAMKGNDNALIDDLQRFGFAG